MFVRNFNGKSAVRADSAWLPVAMALFLQTACSQPQPSLVLITVDTLRRDALGVYSDEVWFTPNIDSLARAGTIWDEARTTFTLTQPSHASVLTGLYPQEHGIYSNTAILEEKQVSVAEELSSAGYDCGAFVNTWVLDASNGFAQGFVSFTRADIESLATPIPSVQKEGALKRTRPNASAARTVGLAMEWIREAKRPYFLWVHFMDPHLDYNPPLRARLVMGLTDIPSDRGSDEFLHAQVKSGIRPIDLEIAQTRLLYQGEVAEVDQALGLLFQTIRKEEHKQPVLCVLVSDHGENIYDDGSYVGHSHSLHPSVVSIPLIMAGYGVPRGRRIGSPVELVQLKATIHELIGIVNDIPDRPSLFAPVDMPQLTLDAEGRATGYWNGWRVIWEPEGLEIIERGTIDSVLAVTRLQDALRVRTEITAQEATRKFTQQDIDQLQALGYLNDAPEQINLSKTRPDSAG